MRLIKILYILLLCLYIPAWAQQGNLLDTKVTYSCHEVAVKEVLNALKAKYGINFSYSGNQIPANKKVTLNVKDKPLRAVLNEVFREGNMEYTVVGKQVVLKKKEVKNQNTGQSQDKPAKTSQDMKADTVASAQEQANVTTEASTDNTGSAIMQSGKASTDTVKAPHLNNPATKEELRRQYLSEKRRLREQYQTQMDSVSGSQGNAQKKTEVKQKLKGAYRKVMNELNALADSIESKLANTQDIRSKDSSAANPDSTGARISSDTLSGAGTQEAVKAGKDTSGYRRMPFQVGFVPPVSSNGPGNAKTVNNISFNVLAGCAAGLEGAEIGGVANIEKDFVRGVQIAGVTNVVGKKVDGTQIAGVCNISGAGVNGAQVAGFMNIAADSSFATQAAGFGNILRGNCRGAQVAGFINIAGGSVEGAQAAGFINISDSAVKGIQSAGFINTSRGNLNGVQTAGFINTSKDVAGAQIAGFINIARKVKGVQIGVINLADSVAGAQIGLLSLAKKGYFRIEAWGGETLNGLAIKLGSRNFYNIFAGGIQPYGTDNYRWAVGYGFGSEVKLAKHLHMNFDLLSFNVNEEKEKWTNSLNLLNQFRWLTTLQFTKRIGIFAGPVFNVMVSQVTNSATGDRGSAMVPDFNFYHKTHGRTNIGMWVGFNAGIRL